MEGDKLISIVRLKDMGRLMIITGMITISLQDKVGGLLTWIFTIFFNKVP